MTSLTTRERELARHALGLDGRRARSYRNFYVVGECEDHTIWLGMATRGLARRYRGNQITGGDDCFRLTRAGALAALGPGEELDSEDFPS